MEPDFDTMNETDVREIIVRPLIHQLGFRHGEQAQVRSEVTLKYDKAFLGRKKPSKDPPLTGRADYICEAISYGRWVVEVKAPNVQLSTADAEQAHTYCAHPEVSGSHFILTNGRIFRLYALGQLEAPLLEWPYHETQQHVVTLFNLLGYEAIKKRARLLVPDLNKPLGKGIASSLRVIGGEVRYGEHRFSHPLLRGDGLNGTTGAVKGGTVRRLEDGRIEAAVSVASPYPQLEELTRAAGLEDFKFLSSDEYVSTELERPTVFQNLISSTLPPPIKFRFFPGQPEIAWPIGFDCTVYTEATGFFEDNRFEGVLSFDYDYHFIRGPLTGVPQIDLAMAQMPQTAQLAGTGTFTLHLAENR